MSSFFSKLGGREVVSDMADAQRGLNTQVANTSVADVLEGKQHTPVSALPEGAQPKVFGTFEEFAAAIMSGDPTYDLQSNGHI